MKYSKLIAQWLKDEGYTTCFFVAGGGIMHLIDGFRNEFNCIPVVHEHSAGVCAEHFNECCKSDEKAFALVTTGPGLTNIVTAIAGCYVEHRELLVIAGQVKSTDLLVYPQRQRGVQEIDGKKLVRNISVKSECLVEPIPEDEFLSIVRSCKVPHPGPVMIEVCLDVQGMNVDPDILRSNQAMIKTTRLDFSKKLAALVRDIQDAERPLFLFGGLLTRTNIEENFPKLEQLGIPCATTTSALDRVPNTSDLYVGRTGTWGGQRAANLILGQADLVVSFGAQLDLQQTGFAYESFCPSAKLVKIFPSKVELEKIGPKAYDAVECDPNTFLSELLKFAKWKDKIGWMSYKDAILREFPALEEGNQKASTFINPFIFLQNLSKASHRNDVFAFCSSGGTFTGSLQMSEIKQNQTATTSAAHASMGYGLATAIGAAFARPNTRVIATEGEGGFTQNLQELALLKKHNLNIKLFIFDNSGYASIRATQRKFFNGAYLGCDPQTGLAFPNWMYLFKAYDIPVETLEKGEESIERISEKLNELQGPQAFIVKVDPDQKNWPAVSTKLNDDGSLVSEPLYDMLPKLSAEKLKIYGKYLPIQ